MSLFIYTKQQDIPDSMQFVNYNDIFFDSIPLDDSEVSKEILKKIDNAEYSSPNTFVGRDVSLGNLNKNLLSTGCKTMLNVANKPDICFDVIECGQNALEVLPLIKNGNILWKNPALHLLNDSDCDICVDNKKFTRFSQVLEYLMD